MDSRVGIVIVTYNSEDSIVALLDSIPAALGELAADVVVVDNGSSDQTAAAVQSRSDCRLIRSANVGYSAGINRGASSFDDIAALVVLNPDLVLGARSIERMFTVLSRSGGGIVVPRLTDGLGRLSPSLRREPTLARAAGLGFTRFAALSEVVTDEAAYRTAGPVDWATGAAMMISWQCFTELAGFDESFFLYSEETDFCLRARDRGWSTVFTPAAVAMHVGGGSGKGIELHGMQLVNRIRLYRRRHGSLASWAYFAFTAGVEITWILRGRSSSARALQMLVVPRLRPRMLNCSRSLMPR